MRGRRALRWIGAAFALFALGLTACGPDFPKCDTDKDCRKSDKGQKQGKLHCLNGLCQECAKDKHCNGPSQRCSAGSCEEIPNYCESDEDCDGDQVCRDNRCGPECKSDDDCPKGQKCKGGSCEKPSQCSSDADCGEGETCRDGACVKSSLSGPRGCSVERVHFDYDSAELEQKARETLEKNAKCIKKKDGTLVIEGHCDERGSNEYNIALGERRARSVYDYLKSLGVDPSRMETISYGEERLFRRCGEDGPESCHKMNRRAEFKWK